MGLNCWVVCCGGDILAVPPTLGGVDAPGEAVITLTADSFKFELEQAPAGAADLRSLAPRRLMESSGTVR